FFYQDRMYSAMGEQLTCVNPRTGEVTWKEALYTPAAKKEVLDSVLTPPVLVNGKVFLGSIKGDVFCLAADSGKKLWKVHIGEPIVFQPAVVQGRVYAATSKGSLYCLETADEADD